MEEITVDASDLLVLFQERVNIMIDLVEHMPDEHKEQLLTIWMKMTERIKFLIKDVLHKNTKGYSEKASSSSNQRTVASEQSLVRSQDEFQPSTVPQEENSSESPVNDQPTKSPRRTSRTTKPPKVYSDYLTTNRRNLNIVERKPTKVVPSKQSTKPLPSLSARVNRSIGERETSMNTNNSSTSQVENTVDLENEGSYCHTAQVSNPPISHRIKDEEEKVITALDIQKEVKVPQKRGRKRKLDYTFTILENGRCQCTICDKFLGNRSNAIVHSRIHSGERPYRCLICGREFTAKPNLKRHELTHEGVKNYECPECHKRFSEKKSVKLHLLTHSGERPYKCDMCEAAFRQLGTLQAHKHIHTGYKGHVCDVCGKAFRQKTQMKLHQLRHENKRTFECDACSKSYFSKGDLNRHHVAVHSVARPYSCQLCGKQFTRLQYFKDHMNTHTGLTPYKCAGCNARYGEYKSLYKHMTSCEKSKQLGLTKKGNKLLPEDNGNVGCEETVEVMTSVEGTEQVIQIVANSNTNEENTCVLYVDSDDLARQVSGGTNFVITGLDQNEDQSKIVILEQTVGNVDSSK